MLYILSGILAGMGAIIMTDLGQVFGISKSTVLWYFRNSSFILFASFLFLVGAFLLAIKHKLQARKSMVFLAVAWLLAVLTSKYMTPYLMFRTQQENAEYISIKEAKGYLKNEDRVLVVDYNGVQRAYPPETIWQAHILGGDFNGKEVIFTYCVMTNLASPFLNDLNGEKVNFKVLAQTNNNLLIWDTKSDEVIQQITQQCEFSGTQLEPIPVLEMTWAGYKKLFPSGTVLFNTWNDPIEIMISSLFSTEETWHSSKWMFNTANLDDKRLPEKEHIIGIRDPYANKQLALTKDYIKSAGILNLTVGDKFLTLAYFPEYETIMAFDRYKDGIDLVVEQIDPLGNTPEYGLLKRAYIYNSALWAVWAYYYPNSEVLK